MDGYLLLKENPTKGLLLCDANNPKTFSCLLMIPVAAREHVVYIINTYYIYFPLGHANYLFIRKNINVENILRSFLFTGYVSCEKLEELTYLIILITSSPYVEQHD